MRLRVRGKHGTRSVGREEAQRVLMARGGGVRAKARVRREETDITRAGTVDGVM